MGTKKIVINISLECLYTQDICRVIFMGLFEVGALFEC